MERLLLYPQVRKVHVISYQIDSNITAAEVVRHFGSLTAAIEWVKDDIVFV